MKLARSAFALVLACALTVVAALAQTSASGTWSLQPSSQPGRVDFETRFDDGEHSHDNNVTVDVSALGLTQAQLTSGGNHVGFVISREAGDFRCDGWIANGKGGGTVVFTPNAAFHSAMSALGYDLTFDQQLTAAMLNLTTEYTRSIADAGYPHLPYESLVSFDALGVDAGYVRTMRGLFPGTDMPPNDIVSLRALKVTGAYVSGLRNAGFTVATPREAVSLMALKVDLAYVKELADVGYTHLTARQLVTMRAMHIDAAYIKRVLAHGIKSPSVDDLVRLKAMGVI
jgi:hypothetical protein